MIINLIGWSFNKLYQIITLHTLNIYTFISQFVFVQSLSCIWLFVTPLTASRQAPLSFTLSQSLLRFTSIESVMLSNHLILCHPLLLLTSIFPGISWPKYWSFSFSITLSNEYSWLVSFNIDWFDLLAVQETLKSLLWHYNSKESILWCTVFFMVKLSDPYVVTGKTIALTIGTFVSKVMSLLFNLLSRFVIALLSTGKHFLISWLQSLSSLI